ncbi:MAG: ATP-binding protein [Pseudomonadota bacterium]
MKWPFLRTTFGMASVVSVVLCCLTLATGYIAQEVAHEKFEILLERRIEDETNLLMKEYNRDGLIALVAALEKRTGAHTANGMGYLLVDVRGSRLAGELEARVPEPGWRERLRIANQRGRLNVHALTTALPTGERLVVSADREPIKQIDTTIRHVTLATTLAMLVLSIGGAWVLGLNVRRRIDGLNRVATAISEGHRDQRMPRDERAGEFDRLAATLNTMLERNSELLTNLQQVSTDIAHDLRTPLGRQQQLLELALSECHDVAEYRQAIEKARLAGQDMLQIFSSLLKISEIESLSLRATFSTIDLTELADRVVDAFRPDAESGGRVLEASLSQGCRVKGDQHLLSQLLVNLVENAMRHTPPGSTIRVGVNPEGNFVALYVQDDGPGIPVADRQRVFQRFVRLDASRSNPGHGLGLSLVKAIAAAHGARLEIEDAQPGFRAVARFDALRA